MSYMLTECKFCSNYFLYEVGQTFFPIPFSFLNRAGDGAEAHCGSLCSGWPLSQATTYGNNAPGTERVHRALVRALNGSAVFTGCNDSPALQGHVHAHIFCESNPYPGQEEKGEITNISIYAPMGFKTAEEQAIQRLKKIYEDHKTIAQLVFQDMGVPADFSKACASPLFARSKSWVSHTPFLPTRHPKATRAGVPKVDSSGRQIGSPEHDLLRLLHLAGFPEPQALERIGFARLGRREVPWSAFMRRREADGRKPAANGAGYGFRIEFAEAVQGRWQWVMPATLGWGFEEDGARYIDL